jgi:hypothetical protein
MRSNPHFHLVLAGELGAKEAKGSHYARIIFMAPSFRADKHEERTMKRMLFWKGTTSIYLETQEKSDKARVRQLTWGPTHIAHPVPQIPGAKTTSP